MEQTNLDVARKSANCALEEVMEGWRIMYYIIRFIVIKGTSKLQFSTIL